MTPPSVIARNGSDEAISASSDTVGYYPTLQTYEAPTIYLNQVTILGKVLCFCDFML